MARTDYRLPGIYNASPITLADGRGSALAVDSSGRLIVSATGSTESVNIAQVGGATVALGQTTMSASFPVTIASNQTALPVSQSGTWTVQPGNTANTTPWLVNAALNPSSTALNTYAVRLTSNTTTTLTSSTAYISSIAISTEAVGTTSTIVIQDKQGTPLKLVPGITTVAVGLTNFNFQTPVKMTSGIDIVTAGAVAATLDVWINYYQ